MTTITDNSAPSRQVLGLVLVVIGSVFFGFMPSAAKLAYNEGANPIALLVVRSALGLIGMAAFLLLRGQRLPVPRSYIFPTALAGITLVFAAGGGMGSVAYIDVSLSSILVFTFPLIVAGANHFNGKAPLTPLSAALIGLAFVGLTLTIGADLQSLNATGVVLALAASCGIAVMVLATTETSKAIGAIRANLHMTIWAGVYFLLLAFIGPMTGLMNPMIFPETTIGWFYIFGAAISFTGGYLLFFIAATIIGSTRASLISFSEPILMIGVAAIVLGERLIAYQYVGIAIVLASLWIMEFNQARAAKRSKMR